MDNINNNKSDTSQTFIFTKPSLSEYKEAAPVFSASVNSLRRESPKKLSSEEKDFWQHTMNSLEKIENSLLEIESKLQK